MKIDDKGTNNTIVNRLHAPDHAKLTIKGNNNSVTVADIPRVSNLEIIIEGDGNLLEMGSLTRVGRLLILIKGGGAVRLGSLSTFEDCYILSDPEPVTIGQDCMVSFATTIRTTDAHGIYDLASGQRTNPPGPIVIEDHVWLAQGSIVSKNTHIGPNAIVGARSYLQNTTVPRNSLMAGVPARVIRKDIVWDRRNSENIYADGADVDPNLWRWVERQSRD